MAIVFKSKKGFSMLEMLACMCIISTLMILTISNTSNIDLDHYQFLNDYLYDQSLAIYNRQQVNVGSGIYFNSMGHVNQARTIDFKNHSVIIHLGSGYATIK